jgi:hypothetical protein
MGEVLRLQRTQPQDFGSRLPLAALRGSFTPAKRLNFSGQPANHSPGPPSGPGFFLDFTHDVIPTTGKPRGRNLLLADFDDYGAGSSPALCASSE